MERGLGYLCISNLITLSGFAKEIVTIVQEHDSHLGAKVKGCRGMHGSTVSRPAVGRASDGCGGYLAIQQLREGRLRMNEFMTNSTFWSSGLG